MIRAQGCYKLEGKGCALIINNVFDPNKKHNLPRDYASHREGAEKDSGRMKALFEELQFKLVVIKQNVCSEVGEGQ